MKGEKGSERKGKVGYKGRERRAWREEGSDKKEGREGFGERKGRI